MFVRVADHAGYAGQRRDFLRRALGVASSDHNPGLGILSLDSADGGAGILIGRCGYRTSIEYDQVGIAGGRSVESSLLELAIQRSPVRLRSAAAKIFHMKGGHVVYGSVLWRQAPGFRILLP